MVLCAMSCIVQVPFAKVTMYLASSMRLTDTRVCAMSGVYSTSQRVMFEKLWPLGTQISRSSPNGAKGMLICCIYWFGHYDSVIDQGFLVGHHVPSSS